MSEEWKEKIKVGNIIHRLAEHVEGRNRMEATQIKAADILLRKVAPDLTKTTVSGSVKLTYEEIIKSSFDADRSK